MREPGPLPGSSDLCDESPWLHGGQVGLADGGGGATGSSTGQL